MKSISYELERIYPWNFRVIGSVEYPLRREIVKGIPDVVVNLKWQVKEGIVSEGVKR